MEITKDKFIQLFKDECSKAVERVTEDSFRSITPINEVVINKSLSLCISKNPIWPTDGTEPKKFTYCGRVLFSSWIVHVEHDLTQDEFEELYDYFEACDEERQRRHRELIISEGKSALSAIV